MSNSGRAGSPGRRPARSAPRKSGKKSGTRGKHATGHPGRGAARSSPSQRKRAHGVVAASGSAAEQILPVNPAGVRLNRWLAERGVASRRRCDELVQEGGVELNGEIVLEPGVRVQPDDVVKVEGRLVRETRRLYYLFYKPKGVLCTEDPRETRPRVSDLVAPLVAGRVYPVGRLDEESEGLLLLTNDGDFANLVAHPRHGVTKTYLVQVHGTVDGAALARLRQGAWLEDGKVVPDGVKTLRRTQAATSLEVRMREGRNREVRRLLARAGFKVKSLKRVQIGPLGVRGLRAGQIRPLTRAERDALVESARPAGEARPPREKR